MSIGGNGDVQYSAHLLKNNKRTPPRPKWTAPFCTDSTKSRLWQNELSTELAPQLKRSQFCIQLNTLMIVEINVVINQPPSFGKGFDLRSVNTLCFENREKVFSQSIVIWIAASWHWRRNMVWLSEVKVRLGSILKPLVTVKLQLRSDLLFSLGCSDCVQHKIDILYRRCFVSHNAAIIQVANYR